MIGNYEGWARAADIETENCLKQMTHGQMGVFKDKLYEPVFMAIFKHLMEADDARDK